jgi:predicted nucleic acid-binding protein
MGARTSLIEFSDPLVADTSAAINLIATGCGAAIISALPNRVIVVDVVPAELETGRVRGRKDGDRLQELVAAGLVEIVKLSDVELPYFKELVIGPAATTLDDGEAATIAYALGHGGSPVLDERKATRICGARFPTLRMVSTVDLFFHPGILNELGLEALAEGVFNALRDARMMVPPHRLEDVVRLIGHDRASNCPSLPKAARTGAVKIPSGERDKK